MPSWLRMKRLVSLAQRVCPMTLRKGTLTMPVRAAGGGGCGRYMDTVLAEDGCTVVAGAGGGIGEGFVSLLTEAFHPRHFQGRHVGEVLAASTFY